LAKLSNEPRKNFAKNWQKFFSSDGKGREERYPMIPQRRIRRRTTTVKPQIANTTINPSNNQSFMFYNPLTQTVNESPLNLKTPKDYSNSKAQNRPPQILNTYTTIRLYK
jgi:hypothetical protein